MCRYCESHRRQPRCVSVNYRPPLWLLALALAVYAALIWFAWLADI